MIRVRKFDESFRTPWGKMRENTFKFAFLFIFAVWGIFFHLPSFTTREYDCLPEKLVNTYKDGQENKNGFIS